MVLADPVAEHNLLTDLTVGQLLAMAATLVVVFGLVRKVNPIMKRLNELLDDWFGEKARPGVEGRKGVMERLSEQDAALDEARKTISPIVDAKAEGNHQEVLHRLDSIAHTEDINSHHLHRVERLIMRHIRESKAWVTDVTAKAADADFAVPPWPDIPDTHHSEEDEPDDPAGH